MIEADSRLLAAKAAFDQHRPEAIEFYDDERVLKFLSDILNAADTAVCPGHEDHPNVQRGFARGVLSGMGIAGELIKGMAEDTDFMMLRGHQALKTAAEVIDRSIAEMDAPKHVAPS